MKIILVFTLAATVALTIAAPGSWAQEESAEEFTLEEIMVTAEKREVNVQSIPASVVALPGDDLVTQGKVTVAQMLESVPNIKFGQGGRGHGPNSNITIRGVKKTQQPGGPSGPVAPSSATYVDGVYDGVGGNFDIERVEVLRGPQGTLYGRAAAGGVVAFHTADPKLEEFSGNVFAEYGTASRINAQGTVNVPLSDKLALRSAVHYFNQDEDYWAGEGVERETKEGRIKVLYQPTEKFNAILSVTAGEDQSYTGGWTQYLPEPDPDSVIEEGIYTEPGKNPPQKSKQYSLEANYDFNNSVLSYIGAIHERDGRGQGAVGYNRGSYMTNVTGGEPSETDYHELRWASTTEKPFTWLIGASYYGFSWNEKMQNTQVSVVALPDLEESFMAPIFSIDMKGTIKEYGIFTEETFELRDDMRITAGLRYDKTKVKDYPTMRLNKNIGPLGASLNPPDWVASPDIENILDLDNVTYKLRFEYDLTPENMFYVSTGTGYISGMTSFGPQLIFDGPPEPGGPPPTPVGVNFVIQPFDQKKVTLYELGSKNRFLDNTLQLNASLFYQDYEGYQEAINIDPGGPPPPTFQIVPLPVIMKGIELDGTWLITAYDKLKLSFGWLDAKVDEYPDLPGSIYTTKELMYLDRIPGLPEVTAVLEYDHTFVFENGSSLVPRIEAHYTKGHYLGQVSEIEVGQGFLPYMYQDNYVLFNLGATWTSPEDRWAITGYVRNATDELVKTNVLSSHSLADPHSVTLAEPRTYSIMVGVKF